MKGIAMTLVLASLGSGCTPVAPKVLCPSMTLTLTQSMDEPCGKSSCPFPDVVQFTISHVLQVDPAAQQMTNGCDPTQPTGAQNACNTNETLAGIPVHISGGSPAITFCPGTQCTPSACPGPNCNPQDTALSITSDSNGLVEYQLLINLDGINVLPIGIGMDADTGPAATESYGPGNSCGIDMSLMFNCQVPATQC